MDSATSLAAIKSKYKLDEETGSGLIIASRGCFWYVDGMPRRPRVATGGYVYHALNRAVGRATIFETIKDYAAFEKVLEEAREQVPMRLLGFSLMPNHWHLVLWPKGDGDLSEYMRWLTNTHTRRWHLSHGSVGTGPLYQGRFKSFPIKADDHFLTVCRYVERKALQRSVKRGTPFGATVWQQRTAKRLGLESTLRDPGRPRSMIAADDSP